MKPISVNDISLNCNYFTAPESFAVEGGVITHCWINNNGIPVLHITGYNLNGEILTDGYYTFA